MDNILQHFGKIGTLKDYEFGTIIEVKSNSIYIVKTTNGIDLTIQDTITDYAVGENVVLALTEGDANTAFIIKKSSKKHPVSVNFIVANNIN